MPVCAWPGCRNHAAPGGLAWRGGTLCPDDSFTVLIERGAFPPGWDVEHDPYSPGLPWRGSPRDGTARRPPVVQSHTAAGLSANITEAADNGWTGTGRTRRARTAAHYRSRTA